MLTRIRREMLWEARIGWFYWVPQKERILSPRTGPMHSKYKEGQFQPVAVWNFMQQVFGLFKKWSVCAAWESSRWPMYFAQDDREKLQCLVTCVRVSCDHSCILLVHIPVARFRPTWSLLTIFLSAVHLRIWKRWLRRRCHPIMLGQLRGTLSVSVASLAMGR